MNNTMVRRMAAAAFVAAGVIGALGAGTAAAASDRRFKGSATGAVTGFIPPATLLADAGGNATHLGKFTRHEQITLGAGGSISGTIAFIAANGDELDAAVSGQFVSGNDVVGTYRFTGGTGRFSAATGSAAFTAHTDFVTMSASFDGTIDY